jgi:hypothetical protein
MLDRELNELVARSWYVLETVLDNERVTSLSEQKAVARLRDSKEMLLQPDGTYKIQIGCLWKDGEPKLENNYAYART